MSGLLVDDITALCIVLAVAFVVFGGVYAYVWRLAAAVGVARGPAAIGFVALLAVSTVSLGLGLGGAVKGIDVMLALGALSVLANWLLVFGLVWSVDRAVAS